MWQILRVLDRLLGVLWWRDGFENLTISTRAAIARLRGKRYGRWLGGVLDAVDPGHCLQAIKTDYNEAQETARYLEQIAQAFNIDLGASQ